MQKCGISGTQCENRLIPCTGDCDRHHEVLKQLSFFNDSIRTLVSATLGGKQVMILVDMRHNGNLNKMDKVRSEFATKNMPKPTKGVATVCDRRFRSRGQWFSAFTILLESTPQLWFTSDLSTDAISVPKSAD